MYAPDEPIRGVARLGLFPFLLLFKKFFQLPQLSFDVVESIESLHNFLEQLDDFFERFCELTEHHALLSLGSGKRRVNQLFAARTHVCSTRSSHSLTRMKTGCLRLRNLNHRYTTA